MRSSTLSRVLRLSIALLLCANAISASDTRGPSDQPVSASNPIFPATAHRQLPNSFWSRVNRRNLDGTIGSQPNSPGSVPTNKWFENLGLGKGDQPIAPMPYLIKAVPQGVQIGLPNRVASNSFVMTPFMSDLTLEGKEVSTRRAFDYDDLSITVQWLTGGAGGSSSFNLTDLDDSALPTVDDPAAASHAVIMLLSWNVLGIACLFLLRIQYSTSHRLVKFMAISLALGAAATQFTSFLVAAFSTELTVDSTDDEWDGVEEIAGALAGSPHAVLSLISVLLSVIQLGLAVVGCFVQFPTTWGKRVVMGLSAQVQVFGVTCSTMGLFYINAPVFSIVSYGIWILFIALAYALMEHYLGSATPKTENSYSAHRLVLGVIVGVFATLIFLGFAVYPLVLGDAFYAASSLQQQQRSLKGCAVPFQPQPVASPVPIAAPVASSAPVPAPVAQAPTTPVAIGDTASKDQRIARGDAPANSMLAHIVQGSPYVTIKFNQITPFFNSTHAFMSLNGQSSGTATGTRFKLALNNGQTWIAYAIGAPITLAFAPDYIRASGPYTGVLRVALMSSAQSEAALDAGSGVYPIAGAVDYSVADNVANLRFTWITEGGSPSNLLMTYLPHHKNRLVDKEEVTSVEYMTIKGPMKGIQGSTWTLAMPLTTIDFRSPRDIDPSRAAAVRSALTQEASQDVGIPEDTYSFGKVVSRYGRLALIADHLGEAATVTAVVNRMKQLMDPWIKQTHPNAFLYDYSWGGIVSKRGMADSGAEYGQGYYNDHHFHYGYFLYASAIIAKFDAQWGQTNQDFVNTLLRDFANPSPNDSYFPTARNKDWFAGHSWANGLFEFGDNRNQESTSESVNGYYGVYLWGLAMKDQRIADWGRLLMATELDATHRYWHMSPSDPESVYPSVFTPNACVGIVWSTKVDYATWFGANVEYIHGIQMLPFTPITEELLPKDWIATEYPVLAQALTRSNPKLDDAWRGFVVMAQSITDKNAAWQNAQSLSYYDNGNSKTNTLYFIATRP